VKTMSHLNLADKEMECDRTYESFPRYKFLNSLGKSELFWSDDWECWYLLTDNWIDPSNGKDQMVGALVMLDLDHIAGVSGKAISESTVHIRSIAVVDDVKGVGLMGLICSSLIRAAEENGVFLWGVARSFECRIPNLFCMKDIHQWRESGDYFRSFSYGASWRTAKDNTRRLMRSYLSNGFCRFELSGHRFQNRFFRDCGFGYRGSGLVDRDLATVLDKRLIC
jgi:hypothetical protein